MAFSEEFADRIRRHLQDFSDREEKKMMGGLAFMVRGKMCVGIDIDKNSGEDRLMVRVGKGFYQEALEKPGARKMDFTGKPMTGYVYVYPEGLTDDGSLEFWVKKSLEENERLISTSA